MKEDVIDLDETLTPIKEPVLQDFKQVDLLNKAAHIVNELAAWSKRYPRSRIYGYGSQPKMDGELIEIEKLAKEWLNEYENGIKEPVKEVTSWDDIIEKFCQTRSFAKYEVQYIIIPLVNWLNENYSLPGKEPVKNAEDVITDLFGIRLDAPNSTPMDKGECIKAMEAYRNQDDDRLQKAVALLKEYEQWEADLISNNEMWWPNVPKDVLPDTLYNKMLELQAQRNELLKPTTQNKPVT